MLAARKKTSRYTSLFRSFISEDDTLGVTFKYRQLNPPPSDPTATLRTDQDHSHCEAVGSITGGKDRCINSAATDIKWTYNGNTGMHHRHSSNHQYAYVS